MAEQDTTWHEAMTQAMAEVSDSIHNLSELNRYCSGWVEDRKVVQLGVQQPPVPVKSFVKEWKLGGRTCRDVLRCTVRMVEVGYLDVRFRYPDVRFTAIERG